MPKKRMNELVSCAHFAWKLYQRSGVWHADGRSNAINAGRHSLGTTDRAEALQRLSRLDSIVAADHGLIPRDQIPDAAAKILSLADGRKLYEAHIKRPRAVGGTRASTQKKYRAAFDKFILFAESIGVKTWNAVTKQTVTAYLTDLEDKEYADTTMRKEAVTIAQSHKWLMEEGHLAGTEPLNLKIRKTEGQRAYCYTDAEVEAMVTHCQSIPSLAWLAGVIVALACTGLRIAELCSLRWSDIDDVNGWLNLTDESGHAQKAGRNRRELKSGRSRQLPLHAKLVAVLAGVPRIDGYIFHGPRGGRLKPDTVRNILIREVIKPLAARFPSPPDEQGFKNGRLHSFRHYFASLCANTPGVTERVAMEWLGHADSEMVRHYYHLHDHESRQQMDRLNPMHNAGNRPTGITNRAADTKPTETTDPGEPVSTAT